MSDDLVKRLRDWEHVWPQDLDEPEGGLYIKAADRIEELEAKLVKAVEKLLGAAEQLDGYVRYGYGDEFREAVAELTGGKDD